MERKHITIYDIAREAEVSPATVSRILNGSSSVKEHNRIRVTQLIEKYNFRPNAMARALTETHTKVIGMMLADANNPYYSSLFTACVNESYKRGYSVMMFNTLSRLELEEPALARLREQRVDAIIISGGSVDLTVQDAEYMALLETTLKTIPIVVATQSPHDMIHGVTVDHERSVDLAMEYLLGLGHKDIGFIYTGEQFCGTRLKLDRFRMRMEEAGLPVREEWLIPVTAYDCSSGREGIDRLMQLSHKPTALLGLNDVIAAGMLQGLLEHGIKVPEDMSLMGFDDTFITSITTPQLTTVGYDYDEYARRLLDAALDGVSTLQNQLLPCKLLLRRSCAAPRG